MWNKVYYENGNDGDVDGDDDFGDDNNEDEDRMWNLMIDPIARCETRSVTQSQHNQHRQRTNRKDFIEACQGKTSSKRKRRKEDDEDEEEEED